MNKLRFIGLVTLLGSGTAMAAVDPGLLNLVMPDATVLSGVQVDRTLASPFGQYILSKMQPQAFQKLAAATGFDPTHDLQQILAATSAASPAKGNGLVLGRGNFQPAQILSTATAAGAAITTYHGVQVIGSPKNPDGAVAFLNPTTVAMGSTSLVEGAIDRNAAGATYSGPLASAAQTASANSAWFVTLTPLSQFLGGKTSNPQIDNLSQNNLFQSVTGASGGLNFSPSNVTITADATTTSAQNAQALADVLKFFVGMIQNNAGNGPGGQQFAALASAATFTANGPVAHISLAVSEQQAEQLFAQTNAMHAAASVQH
ncbi:MAG: hypothetical protein ACRD30_00950 [Bryobacteraceae bacterium]